MGVRALMRNYVYSFPGLIVATITQCVVILLTDRINN